MLNITPPWKLKIGLVNQLANKIGVAILFYQIIACWNGYYIVLYHQIIIVYNFLIF